MDPSGFAIGVRVEQHTRDARRGRGGDDQDGESQGHRETCIHGYIEGNGRRDTDIEGNGRRDTYVEGEWTQRYRHRRRMDAEIHT